MYAIYKVLDDATTYVVTEVKSEDINKINACYFNPEDNIKNISKYDDAYNNARAEFRYKSDAVDFCCKLNNANKKKYICKVTMNNPNNWKLCSYDLEIEADANTSEDVIKQIAIEKCNITVEIIDQTRTNKA